MESPTMLLALLLVVLSAIMAPSAAATPPEIIRLPLDQEAMYDRPVIGIVTHPNKKNKDSRIAASYVKFVESAGARVIPLIYDDSWDNLKRNLSLVNGVLFTGGSAINDTRYRDTTHKIFQHVKDRNSGGDPIPLFAVCLGFELISIFVSKNDSILAPFNATNQPSTLIFPDPSRINGSVFESFGPELIDKVNKSDLAMQNHKKGISPHTWENNSNLAKFFNMLTTSKDKDGKVYVSTVQAKNYPIIGTQWHPEKATFEWGQGLPGGKIDKAPHSEDAVRVTQHFANYFISQARKSTNRPCEDDVRENVIDNYYSKFGQSKSFDKVYIFPRVAVA